MCAFRTNRRWTENIRFSYILLIALLASCTSLPDQALNAPTLTMTGASEPQPTVEVLTIAPSPSPTRKASDTTESSSLAMPVLAVDIFFANENHGWILGILPVDPARTLWEFVIARTSDSGESWTPIPMPAPVSWEENRHGGIFFADEKRGWFFISQIYPFMSALYSTVDGGQSWQEASPRGAIAEISRALNGEIWAMELYEDPSEWRLLMITEAKYDAWYEAKLGIHLDLPPYDVILQDQSHIWLLEWMPHSNGEGMEAEVYDFTLLFSPDNGQNWESIATPCRGFISGTEFDASLIGVGDSDLWLGCGKAAGAGSGTKSVYFSSDGGRTWENRGSSEDGSLPTTGGYFQELDALSDEIVYMNLRRSESIILSRDGGKTWENLFPACPSESMVATFLDQHTGWAFANLWDFQHICLSRTLDGGRTWQCSILPENEPCNRP